MCFICFLWPIQLNWLSKLVRQRKKPAQKMWFSHFKMLNLSQECFNNVRQPFFLLLLISVSNVSLRVNTQRGPRKPRKELADMTENWKKNSTPYFSFKHYNGWLIKCSSFVKGKFWSYIYNWPFIKWMFQVFPNDPIGCTSLHSQCVV